jgi:hypothetical protein
MIHFSLKLGIQQKLFENSSISSAHPRRGWAATMLVVPEGADGGREVLLAVLRRPPAILLLLLPTLKLMKCWMVLTFRVNKRYSSTAKIA